MKDASRSFRLVMRQTVKPSRVCSPRFFASYFVLKAFYGDDVGTCRSRHYRVQRHRELVGKNRAQLDLTWVRRTAISTVMHVEPRTDRECAIEKRGELGARYRTWCREVTDPHER